MFRRSVASHPQICFQTRFSFKTNLGGIGLSSLRSCPYCQQSFQPSRSHPAQLVCSRAECQRLRRTDYHRRKLADDPGYAEKCRESARQWRKQRPGYWDEYRQAHPVSVSRNREQQRARDRKRHLVNLANNTLASSLRPCPATVWLLGPELRDLANKTSAPTQLWVLEAHPRRPPATADLANNTALAC